MTERTARAVASAFPMPTDIVGAMAEYREWEQIHDLRSPFDEHGYEHLLEVEARIALLKDILDNQPVSSWEDIAARMDWWGETMTWGMMPSADAERKRKERISADLLILRDMGCATGRQRREPSVKFGRMTNAEKAEAVKSLLKSNPELSDREIARQAGVSPQTVNNWRARLGLRRAAA